jgi:hypothetical protein
MIKTIETFNLVEGFKSEILGKPILDSYHFKLKRTVEQIRNKAASVTSLINSSHFTLRDLELYVGYYYIYEKKEVWFSITEKKLSGFEQKYFSNDSLKRDQNLIVDVNNELKVGGVDDFFRINDEGGECHAHLLLKNKYISPMFYIKYMGRLSNIEKQSKEQKKTNNIASILRRRRYG